MLSQHLSVLLALLTVSVLSALWNAVNRKRRSATLQKMRDEIRSLEAEYEHWNSPSFFVRAAKIQRQINKQHKILGRITPPQRSYSLKWRLVVQVVKVASLGIAALWARQTECIALFPEWLIPSLGVMLFRPSRVGLCVPGWAWILGVSVSLVYSVEQATSWIACRVLDHIYERQVQAAMSALEK